MSFKCERCGHESTTKGNLLQHLQSKQACRTTYSSRDREDIIDDLTRSLVPQPYKCPYCVKCFSSPSGRSHHKRICKHKGKDVVDNDVNCQILALQEQVNKLTKYVQENENLREQLRHQTEVYASLLQDHQTLLQHTEAIAPSNTTTPTTTKKKKAKIPQTLRIACWNKHIGEDIGKAPCLCCKTVSITQHNFHCGHVVAEANGGKLTVANMRPICNCCNNSMGTMDMREFAQSYFHHDITLEHQQIPTQEA